MKEKLADRDKTREAIRDHQETANWEFNDEAARIYTLAQEMDRRFFNGLVYPDGTKVPAPLIAFEDLRNKNTLACYDLFPDGIGMIGKITLNTQWYVNVDDVMTWILGNYSQGETLVHEYVHLWQQIGRGKDPFNQKKHKRDTHNREFVAKAEELGIHPMPVKGIHTRPATPGSPIDILLKDFGIYPPDKAKDVPDGLGTNWAEWITYSGREKRKGTSTLHKWGCKCGQHARIGTKDFYAKCEKPGGCGEVFVLLDGKVHNIYKS